MSRYAPRSPDFDNPDSLILNECGRCGSDGGQPSFKAMFCDTQLDGHPGESSAFAATACRLRSDCTGLTPATGGGGGGSGEPGGFIPGLWPGIDGLGSLIPDIFPERPAFETTELP